MVMQVSALSFNGYFIAGIDKSTNPPIGVYEAKEEGSPGHYGIPRMHYTRKKYYTAKPGVEEPVVDTYMDLHTGDRVTVIGDMVYINKGL